MKEAEPASCHLFSSPHDALAAALTERGRRGGRPEEVVGAGRSPRTHLLFPYGRFSRAPLMVLLLVSLGVLGVAGEPLKASEPRPALSSGIGGTAGAVREAADAPNFHRKRDNSWYSGERKDPPLQLKIESSVRTYPSRATSPEGARGATGPSYGSYGKAKWGQDLAGGGGVRATHNSLPKGHDRTTTTMGADDLSDRQKRTETQNGVDGGPPSKYSSHLVLKEGAYEGLVVEVNDRISQDDCRTVIDGIQTVLTSWSTGLYTATDGGLSLRSAMVLLPSHWSTRACHPPVSGRPPAPPTQPAHMLISPPHPVFADAPWTQQSGGCGRQGDFIQMGVGFLESANTSSAHAVRAASQLVGEWGKYRWGLFSEAGYAGDNLYLPWYRQGPDWAATVCTDAHAGPPPCHPDHAHHCSWPPEAHRNATSSLLSLPNLPQVTKFCDSKTHNREAPTKQNVLCGRRSAWEVMLEHPDFKAKASSRQLPPRPPEMYFIRKLIPRFVLLVEDTEVMNIQRRWEFVRKAVRRAVVYDLPNGVQVAMVVFNAEAREKAPLSMLESTISDLRERVGSSLPRNPSGVRASQACVACGIKRAVRVLEEGGAPPQAANIILVTSGGHGRDSEAEEVRRLVKEFGLRLLLVLYPLAETPDLPAPPHALVPIARESGGRVFTVMDEGVGIDSKVSMLISLMDALTAAVAAGGATTPVLVHSATYQGGIASLSKGTFALDDSLAAHARFAVYYYDLNHVGNTIHLTAPSGATFASVNMQEEDGDVNMISVNLHNAERGVWKYKVENRADSHQALHIQVTSLPSTNTRVTVRVWTNQQTVDVGSAKEQEHEPIKIYGEIKMGGAAVMDAGVMVQLQRLGTNATGGTYPPVKLQLFDLGTGDPDVTRGDGIYSRYAPPLDGPARYAVLLSVDASNSVLALAQAHSRDMAVRHHRHAYAKELAFGSGYEEGRVWAAPSCCGSVVPYAHTKQATAFTRQVTGPTLDIKEAHVLQRDKVPPGRILDLVAWVDSSSGRVVLDWTAVGEDRDWGRAHAYEAFVASSKDQAAVQCSGDRIWGLPKPSPAGTKERARVPITVHEKKVLWVCMRAIDRQGNRGQPSNPAALWQPQPPSTDRVTIRVNGPGLGGYGSDAGIGGSEKVAVISGCVGGLLLVVVLVATYCYCLPATFKRRLNRRRRPPEDVEKPATSLVNGGSVVVKSTSRGSVLVNPGPDGPAGRQNDTDLVGSPPPPEDRRESFQRPQSQSPPCEALRVEQVSPSAARRGDGDGEEELSGTRGLSLSIPDVTKVERSARAPDDDHVHVPQPQFYTLGRHTRTAQRSPLRDPSGHMYGSMDLSYSQRPVRYSPVGASQYYGNVRPRTLHSDSYSDDADTGSFSEQLLCDDRGASPPPPAPADNALAYSDLHRRSVALL